MSSLLARARSFLRGLSRPERLEAEMDEEMRFHVEMEAERLVRERGLSADEARRQAAVAFGGREKYKEQGRDVRGVTWIPGLSLDVKLGWRMLMKSPGLTLVGVLGMAVGIAISASVFSFLGSALARSLPMDEGDRVVALTNGDAASGEDALHTHLHDLVVWRDELTTVAELGAYRQATRNLIGEGPAEPLRVAEMTASGFRIARTSPHLGRYLVDEDERPGEQAVVVIGYEVWRERFGGREDVVGRTVRMGTGTHTIVGVMPEGFGFPVNNNLWVPLRLDPLAFEAGKAPDIRAFGRLSRHATLGQAQAQIATIGRRLAGAQPATREHLRPTVTHYTDEFVDTPAMRVALQSARFLVGILLLVIAVNVAILVYARTASRAGEIAVRMALGASRGRVVTQLFAEALVLSAAAAVVGLSAAAFLLRHLGLVAERLGAEQLPYWIDFTLSPATVLYVSALTLLAAAVVGVLPALKATNRRVQETLRQLGGATGMRMGRSWTVLIGVQAGIAVALFPLGAALQMQQILASRNLAVSAAMERIVSATIAIEEEPTSGPGAAAYQRDLEARFADRRTELLRRLEAEPGIVAASFASDVPGGGMSQRWLEVEGIDPSAPPARHPADTYEVGPGLFELFGARLLSGQPLPAGGAASSTSAAVVSRSFVESALGGGDAIGRRFRYASQRAEEPGGMEPGGWYEVVGVVSNFPDGAAASPDEDASVYHPVAPGRLATEATLIVRARGASAEAVAGRVWAVASELDPALHVSEVRSAAESARIAQGVEGIIGGALVAVMSAVILLSAAGMHALVAFTVAQRRREIGIRIALGARPRQVVGSILARAARQVAIGLGLGAVAAVALISRVTDTPRGAMLLAVLVAALLLVVGLLSAAGPARRGLAIQPMEALRDN